MGKQMKLEDLRDRRDFLKMQHAKLKNKLNDFIENNKEEIESLIQKEYNTSNIEDLGEIQEYLFYRAESTINAIDKSININSLIFNKPNTLDIEEIEKKLRLRYIFMKFFQSKEFKRSKGDIIVSVIINRARVKFKKNDTEEKENLTIID